MDRRIFLAGVIGVTAAGVGGVRTPTHAPAPLDNLCCEVALPARDVEAVPVEGQMLMRHLARTPGSLKTAPYVPLMVKLEHMGLLERTYRDKTGVYWQPTSVGYAYGLALLHGTAFHV